TIHQLRRSLKLASLSQKHESLLVNNLMYFINLVVLYDLFVYSYSMNSILGRIETMKLCFFSIGSIDASIAAASYINQNSNICNPEFGNDLTLNISDGYHPLLQNYVTNSYATSGASALITGSNMAGKTTFIKTIGVNYIKARSMGIRH